MREATRIERHTGLLDVPRYQRLELMFCKQTFKVGDLDNVPDPGTYESVATPSTRATSLK